MKQVFLDLTEFPSLSQIILLSFFEPRLYYEVGYFRLLQTRVVISIFETISFHVIGSVLQCVYGAAEIFYMRLPWRDVVRQPVRFARDLACLFPSHISYRMAVSCGNDFS